MSCGNPHELDCREVLAAVYLYLDHECADPQRERIRQHLDECAPCLREFGIEAEVKALVSRCCRNEVAPETLRLRIRAQLRSVAVDG